MFFVRGKVSKVRPRCFDGKLRGEKIGSSVARGSSSDFENHNIHIVP